MSYMDRALEEYALGLYDFLYGKEFQKEYLLKKEIENVEPYDEEVYINADL